MEPGVLVHPHALIVRVGGEHLLEAALAVLRVQGQLVVTRLHVPLVGEHPDLQEARPLVVVPVLFAVRDAAAGAHHLDVAVADHLRVAHAVGVLQVALQGNGDDLHVLVRVGVEAHARGHGVVVQHPQHAEVHALRVVVAGEAEGVPGVQPAVVGMASRGGGVQDHVAHDAGGVGGEVFEANGLRCRFVQEPGRGGASCRSGGAEEAVPEKGLPVHHGANICHGKYIQGKEMHLAWMPERKDGPRKG